jgi:NADPH2:quinone reductase
VRAGWYERKGAAREVIEVGEMEAPEPGPGEIRVRLHASGVNPTDCKRRSAHGEEDWNYAYHFPDFPRIIPNNDGAGEVDMLGESVDGFSKGDRVWVYNARYRRAFGTATEYIVLPAHLVTRLPEAASFAEGACLGVPAMTAHRSLFSDGPIEGQTVLVTGGAGCVGNYAVQLAKWGGAQVIASVRSEEKASRAAMADHIVNYRKEDVPTRVMALTNGEGVNRVVDVNLGVNWETNYKILKVNGTIASYSSMGDRRPAFPHYELMLSSITIRLVMVHCSPPESLTKAAGDIVRAMEEGALTHPIAARFPLDDLAAAHEAVESGKLIGNVVVDIE